MNVLYLPVALFTSLLLMTYGQDDSIARINLQNPTQWNSPIPVEIPIGSLASPNLIDWTKVKLLRKGEEIPFAIREGGLHRKAILLAPIWEPSPEDVIVFSVNPTPGKWTEIQLVEGTPLSETALRIEGATISVEYENFSAVINNSNGILHDLIANNRKINTGPFEIQFYSYSLPVPHQVNLVSSSSNPALTVLNYLLEPQEGPSMALSYRFHSSGCTEIYLDERPWSGLSPWLTSRVETSFELNGIKENLPYLVNRAPYYGWKDYEQVIKTPAAIYCDASGGILELGEEFSNGRSWIRRLYPVPMEKLDATQDLIELADEGLIISVLPHRTSVWGKNLKIEVPNRPLLADNIVTTIENSFANTTILSGETGGDSQEEDVILRFQVDYDHELIWGDGFIIESEEKSSEVLISARTEFGLMTAAWKIADYLGRIQPEPFIPLIAENPVADIRAVAPGGGSFEVDIPYGSDQEWLETFDALMKSGVNTIASLGMWSNWKMTVSYQYMPEISANHPNAYDNVTGNRLNEYSEYRDRAQILLSHLNNHGAKGWVWLPVGAVPSSFPEEFPEAMCPGSTVTPCYSHPKYLEYLQAFCRELLETYDLGGITMIRDDSGGICPSALCNTFDDFNTGDPMWDLYLILHSYLRSIGFDGVISVYPYNNPYTSSLESLLPDDLYVVGHGSAEALLFRDLDRVCPMGDTWIDNTFCGFRPASTPRMKRLLADRNSFWISGAYHGQELFWESIGRFGWNPLLSPNTTRYEWGRREFGIDQALPFTRLNMIFDDMHEVYNASFLPQNWFDLTDDQRSDISSRSRSLLDAFVEETDLFRSLLQNPVHQKWIQYMDLWRLYFQYWLRHDEILKEISDIAIANREILDSSVIVKQDGTGDYTSIVEAINAVAGIGNGTVTVEDNGIYAETGGLMGSDWKVDLQAGSGFNPTLQIGTIPDVGWFRAFFYLYSENQKLVIDGFTIQYVDGSAGTTDSLIVTANTPQEITLQNCMITGSLRQFALNTGTGFGDSSNAIIRLTSNRIHINNYNSGYPSGLVRFGSNAPGSHLIMDHCTYVQNPVAHSPSLSVFWAEGDNMQWNISNSILRDDSSGTGPLFNEWTSGGIVPGFWTIDHCNYTAGKAGITSPVNSQTADPLLTNPAGGDFTLIPGSPCIGAGTAGSNIGWEQQGGDKNFFPQIQEIKASGLPEEIREEIIQKYQELFGLYQEFDQAVDAIDSNMLRSMRQLQMTHPLKDWVGGYSTFDRNLDDAIGLPQFAGDIKAPSTLTLPLDSEFELRFTILNRGVRPWFSDNTNLITLQGNVANMALPSSWQPSDEFIVFADQQEVVLTGRTPGTPGSDEITMTLWTNNRIPYNFSEKKIMIQWDSYLPTINWLDY